jgi:hypothetical protein
MTIQQTIEENEKSFSEKFPFIPHADNFGADGSLTGGSDISREVKSFFHLSQLNLIKAVVGEIGAKLLAKHSSQAILDAYFDAANEVLENNETNN